MKNDSRYSTCWKCGHAIMNMKECNYIKSRDGNFNFCDPCYKSLLEVNKDFFQFYKSRDIELKRSFYVAISNFHDRMVEQDVPLKFENNRTVLIHQGEFSNCMICLEILKNCKDYAEEMAINFEKNIKYFPKN